jgi:hypothetical protein
VVFGREKQMQSLNLSGKSLKFCRKIDGRTVLQIIVDKETE